MLKNIAILTSGNDCPGMNAAIRAVVRTARHDGVKIWGVRNGYKGLIRDQIEELSTRSVGDMIQRGGTFLGTARCPEFMEAEKRQLALENLQKRGIEGLIVIGGAGSLAGAWELSKLGMNVVGIPGTIENDVWGTDYTIGSDTAANTVVDAINKLRDTACAHRRIILIEVMGKTSGWLAMTTGIAGGAEYVLAPEAKYNLDRMCAEIRESYEAGKRYSIIVVSEGAASAVELGKQVGEKTEIDTRVTVLGHIQRGGSPTVQDRINASLLGEKATLGLLNGESGIMYGLDTGTVVEIPLEEAATNTKTLDPEFIRLSKVLA
ncbi:MAG: 6-phosphofructokinase [Anaerovibrio sp.]|uniref:ATP-dependent 6-phosphofructokinase n=2 Tax=Anaerovibrio TaxID=82373 RepID=A0A6I2U8Z8_9FIRM|nr:MULTISPECIES: 6-phosphofructokinase [Anaerovibrio]MEE1307246.1 6-phosphofructokinase [Anaerovibrio sp.]MSU07868.1 6-phosphofructokinase [Anaerovibrio slackiae]